MVTIAGVSPIPTVVGWSRVVIEGSLGIRPRSARVVFRDTLSEKLVSGELLYWDETHAVIVAPQLDCQRSWGVQLIGDGVATNIFPVEFCEPSVVVAESKGSAPRIRKWWQFWRWRER